MSKYESAFKSAILEQERRTCLDLLKSTPDLTLAEIHKLARGGIGRLFSTITVGELLGLNDAPRAEYKTSAPGAAVAGVAAGGAAPLVNTRTAEGRAAYDAAILEALKEQQEPVSASVLIAKAGGSKLQARAALNRLIESKKVTWTGKARGTKYSVA